MDAARRFRHLYSQRIIDGMRVLCARAISARQQHQHERSKRFLQRNGFSRALRRLFPAFTAIIFVTGAGCAWAADGFGPEQPCPLTPEQARKAAAAFSAMRDVYRHPRCINCHGVYADLHDNPNTRHPGEQIDRIERKKNPEADACVECHDDGERQWKLPQAHQFFTRTDIEVCKAFKAFKTSRHEVGALDFLNHLADDHLVKLAFQGKKGHSDKPADPPRYKDKFADPPRKKELKIIIYDDFMTLAEAWVAAVYGTNSQQEWAKPFPGGKESTCGCDPNLTQAAATGTGLVDLTVVVTRSCPGDGEEPRYYSGVTVKIGPHTLRDPASSTLKLLLPAGTYPVSAVSESDASAKLGFIKRGYPGTRIEPRDGVATVKLGEKTEGLQIGMHVCAPGAAPTQEIVVMLDPVKEPAMINDKVTITGRVWSSESSAIGSSRAPVQANVRVGHGSIATDAKAPSMGEAHTDGNGFFSIEALLHDSTDVVSHQGVRGELNKLALTLAAIPDDKNRYKTGIASFELPLVDKGPVEITVKTDKAIYQKGEPVTVSGTVTSEGKGVAARLKFALDPPPIKDESEALAQLYNPGRTANFAETTSTSDGNYRHTFHPDRGRS